MFLWGFIALIVFFISDPYLWPSPIERLKESILFHASYAQSAHVQQTGCTFSQPLVWLAQSFPWHPGVFSVAIDLLLISILAIVGLSRMWAKERVYGVWLGSGRIFPVDLADQWPQYILILTAPLSIGAAEGIKGLLIEPVKSIWQKFRTKKQKHLISVQELIKSTPWLLPGLIALSVLLLYPLVYQLAMSVTDFSGPSIKDGIEGWGLAGSLGGANRSG